MNQQYEDIRQQSMHWIRQAGLIARARLGTAVASQKPDRSPVTDVDHAVQAALLEAIARHFPCDAVIAEETLSDSDQHASVCSADRCWVIDPIDGTRNYARGLPVFAISVALMEAGSPVVGWVFNPMTGQMHSASRGGGAWLDDERIQAADEPLGDQSFIAVPSGREAALPAIVHEWIDQTVLRSLGSTALHLAFVASGALDAAFSGKCRLWDIAAGVLVAEEAGAVVCSLQGQPYFPLELKAYDGGLMPFLAAGPTLLKQLLAAYHRAESMT
jgi:myo-inositol-1(or 4)-monophosphatase